MHASSKRQKQTLKPLEFRRLASPTIRHSIRFVKLNRKRLGTIGLGVAAGLGIPSIVFASQQYPPDKSNGFPQATHIFYTEPTTSSASGEVSSSLNEASTDSTSAQPSADTDTSVTIDGEAVPLYNGSVSKHLQTSDGSVVDVTVTIDNASSASSNTYTDITIDSSSSTTGDQNNNRGSPRR